MCSPAQADHLQPLIPAAATPWTRLGTHVAVVWGWPRSVLNLLLNTLVLHSNLTTCWSLWKMYTPSANLKIQNIKKTLSWLGCDILWCHMGSRQNQSQRGLASLWCRQHSKPSVHYTLSVGLQTEGDAPADILCIHNWASVRDLAAINKNHRGVESRHANLWINTAPVCCLCREQLCSFKSIFINPKGRCEILEQSCFAASIMNHSHQWSLAS